MKKLFSKPIRVHLSPDKTFHESLKNIFGLYPKNIGLYKSAFRHSSASSFIKEGIKDSNERLEFLGDSIISSVVADYLFKKFPFKDEGFLTKMRSRMVSRNQHNQIALKLGLNKFIDAQRELSGVASSINGDAYEALIGAIYLDRGYEFVQQFLLTRIINIHIDMDEVENKEVDFKSKLIEWVQKEKKVLQFETISDGNTSESRQFIVNANIDTQTLGTAQHFSKKRAEQLAAETACANLGI